MHGPCAGGAAGSQAGARSRSLRLPARHPPTPGLTHRPPTHPPTHCLTPSLTPRPDAPKWVCVDVQLRRKLGRQLSLEELKAHSSGSLAGMVRPPGGTLSAAAPPAWLQGEGAGCCGAGGQAAPRRAARPPIPRLRACHPNRAPSPHRRPSSSTDACRCSPSRQQSGSSCWGWRRRPRRARGSRRAGRPLSRPRSCAAGQPGVCVPCGQPPACGSRGN